ncbi:MAG: nucleotidyltransferase domain-containing protein [Candidatus Dadabacteria bacterium]|nr:nucleotidyltransferase domain-containing protein [Candidatus Dadabacteria bacterium]
MAKTLDTLLDRIVKVLVDEADPEQIILFGSCARGDVNVGSDIDLVIVETLPFGEDRDRRAETARLYRALIFSTLQPTCWFAALMK